MADNKTPAGVAFKVATRETTYSGETADVQAVSLVTVSGSDDAKTATDVSASNPLPVAPPDNVVDTNNSSAVALTGAAPTFTGTATDALAYSAISVFYNSDKKASVTVQWSADNSNFEGGSYDSHDKVRISHYAIPVRARYFKVVVTKTEAGDATHTEIQTILRKHHAPTDVSVRGLVRDAEADFGTVRPVMVGAVDDTSSTNGVLSMHGGWLNTVVNQGPLAHDSPATGGSERYPILTGGYASAAAPANVSADGDAVRDWRLRNGATATVITAAGALIPGDATNGLDVDVTRVPAPLSTTGGGTEATALRVTVASDSTGLLPVSLASVPSHDVTNAGTFAVQSSGNVAHDAADSGNPQKIGGKASTKLADDTLVADLDRVDAAFDLDGAQVTRVGVPLGDILVERISNTNGTSTAFSTFNNVASTRNYVSSIVVFNDSTTNCFVDIRDGTAGSVILTLPCPAKGGASMSFPVPLRQPTVNTALAYDVSAAITTVYISVVGFQSKA